MKDINIVYVNYFTKEDLLKSLEGLFFDILECPYDVRVTVVDNSQNQDGVKEVLEIKFPKVKYIDAGANVGFGKGNSLGFKDAPARYYFALNTDTYILPEAKTIERIIKFMDAYPKIGCIGPKLVNMDNTLQYACYRFDWRSIAIKPLKHINLDSKYKWVKKYTDRLSMKDFSHNETRPVDWVLGAALVVRREVAEEIGWFDGRYFMYMEDCDWCRTMWDHGWPVYYVHDIIIQHRHARQSAQVPGILKALLKNKLARLHLLSWIYYMWKWRGKSKYYYGEPT